MCGIGNWSKGLENAGQVLYHWITASVTTAWGLCIYFAYLQIQPEGRALPDFYSPKQNRVASKIFVIKYAQKFAMFLFFGSKFNIIMFISLNKVNF